MERREGIGHPQLMAGQQRSEMSHEALHLEPGNTVVITSPAGEALHDYRLSMVTWVT